MPTETSRITKKYRVIIQEYQTWTEYATREELEAPQAMGEPSRPTQTAKEQWVETDSLTSTDPAVIAGLLRSKAEALDPKKTTTRGYDA